jgi:EF hand
VNRGGILAAAAVAALLAGRAEPQSFNRADPDHDGFVTYQDARWVMPRLNEVTFGKCDSNGDGRLDKTEYLCLQGIYQSLYRQR